jgi:phosphatidylserine decarboxylase
LTVFILLQYVLPKHALSRLIGWLARVRTPWFKNALVGWFVRSYQPDMSDAAQQDPLSFPTFNEFFTRELRAGARPLADAAKQVLCPVDGTVSELGAICGDRVLQAKSHDYRLVELLAGNTAWASRFVGGEFATIYLAPYNYHRIHMPAAGTMIETWYAPGQLFSVNRHTVERVPRLFARNERVVCLFEEAGSPFAVVLVGALNVGSMDTVWHGNIAPRRQRAVTRLPGSPLRSPQWLAAGAELGRFNMGSTVVLLFAPGYCRWRDDLQSGAMVRMGQALADRGPRS